MEGTAGPQIVRNYVAILRTNYGDYLEEEETGSTSRDDDQKEKKLEER